ncbi:SAM-dependent methyltransferase [Streptomyces smyrnaeus]|uniref:SAM-dependent methyltransferase n=1 Tax=Streptomyces smyrnaeus TaxID=1387713 RepID=UPI0036A6DB6E
MSNQPITGERSRTSQGKLAKVRRMFRSSETPDDRVRSFYEVLDRMRDDGFYRDILGNDSLYMNYGYWAPGCTDHDDACQALAEELGEAAGIGAGDRVLDVGFGFAEQDFHWLRTRKPREIVGINVTPSQVAAAQQRAEELGFADRLDLRVGSATSLPFEDGSFDAVVALEASAHFHTRDRFFAEAFRVLRPGGILATTDPLPAPAGTGGKSLLGRLDEWRRKRVIPDENWYSRQVYAERLTSAGFAPVTVRDVTDRVLVPNAEYVRERCAKLLRDPRYRSSKQKNSITWHVKLTELRATTREYVLASAEKPRDPHG